MPYRKSKLDSPEESKPRAEKRAASGKETRPFRKPAAGAPGTAGDEDIEVRLHKFMADSGVASRRKCEEVISGRRVRVNGEVVTEPGTKIRPGKDQVTLDGAPVEPRTAGFAYYLFNKPRGCVVTAHDPEGRPTIYDYLDKVPERVVPVGRLDFESEGLLILTNDGELAFRLMHPSYGIEKEYEVTLNKPAEEEALDALREGVEIEGGKTSPAKVKVLSPDRKQISITITEGRKRQVRYMVQAIDLKVARLTRVREGGLQLGTLTPGKVRWLTKEEIAEIRKEVGLETVG